MANNLDLFQTERGVSNAESIKSHLICDEPNYFRCDLYMTNNDSTPNIECTYSLPYNSDYVSSTREVKVGMTDAQYVLSNTGNGLDFTFDCEVRPIVFLSAAWSFMADPI